VITALLSLVLATAAAGAEPADLRLAGEWEQGALIVGQAPPGTRLWFHERELRLSADGRFVFGLDRDEPETAELKVQLPQRAPETRTFTVRRRAYDIQRIDGLPPAQVTPPPEALKRIAEDIALSRAARHRDSPRADFAKPFIWPALGRISGVFGSQRILNGEPKQPHYGVDVAAPTGTPVRAPAGGIVSLAHDDMYYTGGTLMIDHGHGLTSAFLHLSKVLVKEGQEVRQGDLIGKIGATGRVTGPHLDWRVSWFDARIDAQKLVGPMPEDPAPASRQK